MNIRGMETESARLKQIMLGILHDLKLNELNMIDAAKAKDVISLRRLQYNDKNLSDEFITFTNRYKEQLR